MWNSAVFIAAAAILGLFILLCPLRLQMVASRYVQALIAFASDALSERRGGKAHMPKLLHWATR